MAGPGPYTLVIYIPTEEEAVGAVEVEGVSL